MRRALWREAKADVLSRPWQTLLLLLVVLIGAAGIVAGLGQRQSAASQWDGAVSRANGPDIAIYGTNVAVLQHIAASPSVRQAAPLIPVTYDTNIVLGGPKIQLPLRGTASEPPVGRPLIEAGRWLSPTSAASNEIVLERSFSLAKGIAVGDRITIGGPGGTGPFVWLARRSTPSTASIRSAAPSSATSLPPLSTAWPPSRVDSVTTC